MPAPQQDDRRGVMADHHGMETGCQTVSLADCHHPVRQYGNHPDNRGDKEGSQDSGETTLRWYS